MELRLATTSRSIRAQKSLKTALSIHAISTTKPASRACSHGDIASMVAIDNGTTAPGQNSRETGVTIAMADSDGPFDYHLTNKLVSLCEQAGVPFQRDIFRHYRSDSASAIEAGNDIRTALVTFGIDASHGYERIHEDALLSVAQLLALYVILGVAFFFI